MEWLLLQGASMFMFAVMCFLSCILPAMLSQRLQQNVVCSDVIGYLNCVSGGVFAATFFIMYNHINRQFEILLANERIWQESFVLGAFVVFLGFVMTGLLEKVASYIQRRSSRNATNPAAAVSSSSARREGQQRLSPSERERHARRTRDHDGTGLLHNHNDDDDAEEMSPLNSTHEATTRTLVTPTMHSNNNNSRAHQGLLAARRMESGSSSSHRLLVPSEDDEQQQFSSTSSHTLLNTSAESSSLAMQAIGNTPINSTANSHAVVHDNDADEIVELPDFNFHQHSSTAHAAGNNHNHQHNHADHHHHHHHHHHIPASMMESDSTKRFIILLISLSAHSVFEGMALGVQTNKSLFIKLFVSILLHEVLMAMAIGLSLGDQRMAFKRKLVCSLLFSIIIPIGQLLGLIFQAISQAHSGANNIYKLDAGEHATFHDADADAVDTTSAVIQALAVGTFLYVTFFEILPERMHRADYSVFHVGFTIIGFLLMPVASLLQHRHY